jgi:hypothetical protein
MPCQSAALMLQAMRQMQASRATWAGIEGVIAAE